MRKDSCLDQDAMTNRTDASRASAKKADRSEMSWCRSRVTPCESERKYRELVQSAPAAIYELDFRRRRFTQVNNALCRLLGYSREELLAMNPMVLLDPAGQAAFQARIRQWLAGEEPVANIEYKVSTKERRELWVLLNASFTRDENGKPLGATVIAHDITERKKMEEALRRSEASLKRSQEIAHLGSWELDLTTNRLTWSDEVYRIFGLRPREFEATYGAFLERVHPDDRAAVDAAYSGSLREGRDAYEIEHRVVRKDTGEIRHVQEKCQHVRDGQGRVVLSQGMVLDITERKTSEEALQRLSEFPTENPNPVMRISLGHALLFANEPARKWLAELGWRPGGPLPKDVLTLVDEADCRKQACETEITYASKTMWLTGVQPVGEDHINLYGRDVTERRRAEQALREADRRKDEFLAMLAHELRNPLAPMRNAVHLLKLARNPDNLRRPQEILDRQITHMARLLDDLLDVSRITRGRITLHKQSLFLPEILQHAVETVAPAIRSRHLALVETFPDEALWVEGDRDRLAQVFGNLLGNAVKYTPEHGRIRLELRREGGEAVVRVRDNGQGIEPELLPRLFDLFVQGSPSSGSQGGLGIGLTMVKMLVAMHGGSVAAASPGPGLGSEFCVRLPIAETGRDRPGQATEHPEERLSLRVLVVDDMADAAESLAEVLAAWGCQTRTALGGQAGLETVRAFAPDAVLMDIGMPGMDGHETARRLRKETRGKDLLLVALSGYGQDQDRQKSREAGFDAHLVKPVDYGLLRRLLAARAHGKP